MLIQLLVRILRRAANVLDHVGIKRYYVDDIAKRDAVLRSMMGMIRAGTPWSRVICDRRAASHGERLPEYTYVYDQLIRLSPARLLDVGCVLNNRTVDAYIPAECEVSFLNPASEPICRSRAIYHKMRLEEFHGRRYPLVTCLSTLEHIGFDNTRYGTALKDEGWDWAQAIDSIVKNVEKLTEFVEPGGVLLVSCPYGQAEYVRLPPGTGARVWQVLHAGHVEALRRSAILRNARFVFTKLTHEGWQPATAEEEYQPFGAVSCGASGLLILQWKAESKTETPS